MSTEPSPHGDTPEQRRRAPEPVDTERIADMERQFAGGGFSNGDVSASGHGCLPPKGIRPIFFAVVFSFVWFVFLSPVILSPLGERLSAAPLDTGQAKIASCSKDWRTFGKVWTCDAQVDWNSHADTHGTVRSRSDVSHRSVAVAARSIRHGRDAGVANFSSSLTVTADYPTNGLWSVTATVLCNLGVMALVWTAAGIATSVNSSRTRP